MKLNKIVSELGILTCMAVIIVCSIKLASSPQRPKDSLRGLVVLNVDIDGAVPYVVKDAFFKSMFAQGATWAQRSDMPGTISFYGTSTVKWGERGYVKHMALDIRATNGTLRGHGEFPSNSKQPGTERLNMYEAAALVTDDVVLNYFLKQYVPPRTPTAKQDSLGLPKP
jgi:hypothetical protein